MCSDQGKMSAATLYNSKVDKRASVQEIQEQLAQNICSCNVYLKGLTIHDILIRSVHRVCVERVFATRGSARDNIKIWPNITCGVDCFSCKHLERI